MTALGGRSGVRVAWIDYARAIGIVLVVYGHVVRGLLDADLLAHETIHRLMDSVIYSFHMPLFFLLSGLNLAGSMTSRGVGRFVASKVDRLLIPYVIWSILQGTLEVAFSNWTNNGATWSQVLSLAWSPRAQFWFLYALFLAMAATGLARVLAGARWPSLFLVLSTVAYLYAGYIPYTLPRLIAEHAVFLAVGVLVAPCSFQRFTGSHWLVLPMIVAAVLAQWCFHGPMGLTYEDRGVASLVVGLVSITACVLLCRLLSLYPLRSVLYLGQASMAIYLMHIVPAAGGRILLQQILGVSSPLAYLAAGMLLGLGLPLLADMLIRRFRLGWLYGFPLTEPLVASAQDGTASGVEAQAPADQDRQGEVPAGCGEGGGAGGADNPVARDQ